MGNLPSLAPKSSNMRFAAKQTFSRFASKPNSFCAQGLGDSNSNGFLSRVSGNLTRTQRKDACASSRPAKAGIFSIYTEEIPVRTDGGRA